jgi:hypothetical protein
MGNKMTHQSRAELANAIRARYRSATGGQKHKILDEFIAVTGYHEKSCGFRRCRSVIPIQAGHRSGRCRSRFDAVDKTIRENRSSVNAAWLWVRP